MDHRLSLGLRRYPGVRSLLLARPASVGSRFRGGSTRGAVRWARGCPALASAGGLGAVECSPPGGLLRPFERKTTENSHRSALAFHLPKQRISTNSSDLGSSRRHARSNATGTVSS